MPLSGTKRPHEVEVDDDDLSNKRKRYETAPDKDARIVDKLFDDTDFLNHLLRIKMDSKSQAATEDHGLLAYTSKVSLTKIKSQPLVKSLWSHRSMILFLWRTRKWYMIG